MDRPLVERDDSRGDERHDPFPHRRLGPGRHHLDPLECAASDLRDPPRDSADALLSVRPRPLHPVGRVAERPGSARDVFEICRLRVRHHGGIRTGSAPGVDESHHQWDDPNGHRHFVGVLPGQRHLLAPRLQWRGPLRLSRPGNPPSNHPRDERHPRDTPCGKHHPPLPHRLRCPRESRGSLGNRRLCATHPPRPTPAANLVCGDGSAPHPYRRPGRWDAGADGPRDEVATSAMLTLVHQFVRDSFQGPQGTGGELKSFQVDDKEVTIAKGLFLYLAVVGKGTKPRALSSRLVRFLAGLESAYGPRLEKWDGLRSSTGNLDADLAWFLRKGYRMPTLGRAVRYHA